VKILENLRFSRLAHYVRSRSAQLHTQGPGRALRMQLRAAAGSLRSPSLFGEIWTISPKRPIFCENRRFLTKITDFRQKSSKIFDFRDFRRNLRFRRKCSLATLARAARNAALCRWTRHRTALRAACALRAHLGLATRGLAFSAKSG